MAHVERRTVDRRPCYAKARLVTTEGSYAGTLEDVGPGGLRLRLKGDIAGHATTISFRLPTGEPIEASIRALRNSNAGSDYHLALVFESTDENTAQALRTYVKGGLSIECLRGLHSTHRLRAAENLVPLPISELSELLRSVDNQTRMELLSESCLASLTLRSVRHRDLRLDSPTNISLDSTKRLVWLTWVKEGRRIFLQGHLIELNQATLLVRIERIAIAERRTVERHPAKLTMTFKLENKEHNAFLLDYSWMGARIQSALSDLQPGTNLSDVKAERLLDTHSATIRYVQLQPDNSMVFGVSFTASLNRTGIIEISERTRLKKLSSLALSYIRPSRRTGPATKVSFYTSLNQRIEGLFNYTKTGDSGPIFLLAPGWGKRKESAGPLAVYLMKNLQASGLPGGVLRFDATNAVGESDKHPNCTAPGDESLRFTMSGLVQDIEAAVDFCYQNDYFAATTIILISFSASAIAARRVVSEDRSSRVRLWIAPMGATDAQDLIRNSTGGMDLVHRFLLGEVLGKLRVVGNLIDAPYFGNDVTENGFALLEQACSEIKKIKIPIIWILHSARSVARLSEFLIPESPAIATS